MKRINIAIDGFSSCGKSTLAKELAKHLGYTYIDSGAMYRATTLFALNNGYVRKGILDEPVFIDNLDQIDIAFEHDPDTGKSMTLLNGKNVESRIRGIEVSRQVSVVARIPAVREKLVRIQQELGKKHGVVMDGRDIGTVVFPEAQLKIYMTASPEVRAKRRYDELKMNDLGISLESVMANIQSRDEIDSTRQKNPLRQAEDALVIDNSDMSQAEQLAKALAMAHDALERVQA